MAVVEKPRIRVKARTVDSVQNFIARVGLGTPNQAAATTYGPSPISRNRLQLEYAYRSSWICRQVVDAPAEDMTRAGIDIETKDPKDGEVLQKAMQRLAIWPKKRETIQWSRLYGGAIGVIMIDGQDEKTPLRPETVGKNAFKGILPLDRWSVQPSFTDLISELGPNYGQPKFYEVTAAVMNLPRLKVHYSRVVRFEGEDLPIWQKMTENGWGLSVLEPVWDRLTSFDSTTVGIGQLVFKAHLRTLQVEGLREALASNGPELTGIMKNIDLIRATQTNEGMTLLDIQDKFEAHQYSFGGLSDVLIQFAQQLAGAAQIPLVRLFGQSPAGLGATGDADIRNYYDAIKSQQENRMRTPMGLILEVLHWSELGRAPDTGFSFSFRPLWQMSDKEKVEIATNVTTIVTTLEGAAIINRATALKELRQSSEITGMFTSITDDDITEAENEPPEPGEDDGVPPPIAPEQDDLVDQDEAGEGGAGAAREPAEARSAGASERGKAGAKDRARPRSRARTRDGDDFSESDHPRGKGGQFAKGSGGGSARTEKTLHGPDKAKAALKDWKARTPYTDVEDLLAVTPANQSHLEKAGALISEATKAVFKTPGQKKPEGARENSPGRDRSPDLTIERS